MQVRAGEFSAGGATGLLTVPCGGGVPDLVVFFGANQPGSATGANLGLFFGLAFRDEANPAALLNHSWFQMPNLSGGNSHIVTNSAFVSRATPNGAVTLDAHIVSFDPGSFTLNISTAGGARTIRYLAISVADEVPLGRGHAGGAKVLPTSLDIGFRARSAIGLHAWDDDALDGLFDTGYAIGAGNAPTGALFVGAGVGSYPVGGGGNLGGGFSSSYQYQASLRSWVSSLAVPNLFRADSIGAIINTIVGGTRDCAPSSPTAVTLPTSAPADTFTTAAWFDGESSIGLFTPPATLDGVAGPLDVQTHNPNLGNVGAVLWMIGAPYRGSGSPANGRVPAAGFGLWTPTYQGCVFVDGDAQTLYQSSTRSWCVSAQAAGATAGVTEVSDGSLISIRTTEVGGPAFDSGIVAFALGGRKLVAPIPAIYRRIRSY